MSSLLIMKISQDRNAAEMRGWDAQLNGKRSSPSPLLV